MLSIPGMTVTAPKDGSEMLALLRMGTQQAKGPWSVRWPRDTVPAEVPALADIPGFEVGTWEILRNGGDVVILAVGTMVQTSLEAAEALEADGIQCTVVNCRFLKPYDTEVFQEMVRSHPTVLTVEEGQLSNGFGAFMSRELDELGLEARPRLSSMGIPDEFVEHGARGVLMKQLGLDADGIVRRVRQLSGKTRAATLETA